MPGSRAGYPYRPLVSRLNSGAKLQKCKHLTKYTLFYGRLLALFNKKSGLESRLKSALLFTLRLLFLRSFCRLSPRHTALYVLPSSPSGGFGQVMLTPLVVRKEDILIDRP